MNNLEIKKQRNSGNSVYVEFINFIKNDKKLVNFNCFILKMYFKSVKYVFKLYIGFLVIFFAVGSAIDESKGGSIINFIHECTKNLQDKKYFDSFDYLIWGAFYTFIGLLIFMFFVSLFDFIECKSKYKALMKENYKK